MAAESPALSNFLRAIIEADLASGKHTTVATRFPPEPNGYLHIGHAKSICLNFGLAADFGGRCHLRYDDTNPEKEEMEYIRAIERDVRWLGFDWGRYLYYASDFFEDMYQFAVGLIEDGRAYVDEQDEEQIRANRGTVTEPGKPSPWRDRPSAESQDLFRKMRAGELPDGACVLRAKIDMSAVNMKMRDPLLYRIRHTPHPHVGDKWPIYPFYDYAHPLEDALEGITHSFCTLEFDNNRELYDWVLDNVRREWNPRPRQYEFARLDLEHTVMSKRKLLLLVKDGHVDGWDDPRMPTLAGFRRRGVTPTAIREFSERIGVAKAANLVDYPLLEACVREDLDAKAPRRMGVLDPLPLVIEDWPADRTDAFDLPDFPTGTGGSRSVPFGRTVLIEREDFAETPPAGWFRLAPGAEVRLRGAWIVRCTGVDKDPTGRVVGLRGAHDPQSRGANAADGRKVKGTLHWVSAEHAVDVPVRLYDHLFATARPSGDPADLNAASLTTVVARCERALASIEPGQHVQLERVGYFFSDPVDSKPGAPVLNRVVALKDSWARAQSVPIGQAVDESAALPVTPSRSEPPKPAERPARTPAQDDRFALYRKRGLESDDADLIARDEALAAAFTEALAVHGNAKGIANWLVNDLRAALKERSVDALPFGGAEIGALVALVDAGRISSRGAKDVFAVLQTEGGDPATIVKARGWEQVSDETAIAAAVDAVLAELPDKVAEYRAGRTGLLGLFTGQVMKRTGGKANPQLLKQLLEARLA